MEKKLKKLKKIQLTQSSLKARSLSLFGFPPGTSPRHEKFRRPSKRQLSRCVILVNHESPRSCFPIYTSLATRASTPHHQYIHPTRLLERICILCSRQQYRRLSEPLLHRQLRPERRHRWLASELAAGLLVLARADLPAAWPPPASLRGTASTRRRRS